MIEARFQHRLGGFTLDVDLRLPASGITVLFGPSGCGKTTLLRCLSGLTRPQRGHLRLPHLPHLPFGERPAEVWQSDAHCLPPHQRAIGLVFQEASLFPHLSVQGNLDYGLQRIPTLQRSTGQRTLAQAIELLGIGALLQRLPDTLSGGERQRVAMARALATAPRLLLMDEPLAALDAARKAELLPFLDRLHRELTLPIVYVTHALPELMRLADHVVLLDQGHVRAQGSLTEMLTQLDSPLAQDEAAGVVLPCRVGSRDEAYHLLRLDFDGGHLWTRDDGQTLGSPQRVRVAARDVSISVDEPTPSSISQAWPGVLQALAPDAHPSQQLALVRVGGVQLISRITRRSAERLALIAGQQVWVQVKSVALVS